MQPGERIRAYRTANKLSQRELAAQFRVQRETLASWEAGKLQIGAAKLPRIAEVTGIAPVDLRPDLAELLGVAGAQ